MRRILPVLFTVAGLSAAAQNSEDEFYRIDTFPDRGLKLEIGALTKLGDGSILLGTRTGDVFFAEGAYEDDPEKVSYRKYARGLAQPLGFLE
ncbi:MAG: auracyanin family protein, partial [Verrucomicrobiota bacterium]|nr:auracyanin family protein [Verrucomicrobiota bacterium]